MFAIDTLITLTGVACVVLAAYFYIGFRKEMTELEASVTGKAAVPLQKAA